MNRTKTVMLDGPPPILEVSQLEVPGAVEVYALLFESAYKTREYDKKKHLPWSLRRDSGATTEWSIKGIASQLHIGKKKVGDAVDALLDAGFIRVLGYMSTGQGSKKRIFQVIKYNQLEKYRGALSAIGHAYGKTGQKTRKLAEGESVIADQMIEDERIDSAEAGWVDIYQDDIDSCTDFLEEEYDPEFYGLYEGDFAQNVRDRLSTYTNDRSLFIMQ